MATTGKLPLTAIPYRADVLDRNRSKRCAFTGAIFTFAGTVLLWLTVGLARNMGAVMSTVNWRQTGIAYLESHPEIALPLLLLATAATDTLGGIILLKFTLDRRRMVIATLLITGLVHLGGAACGLTLLAGNGWDHPWGSMMAALGLSVAVPYSVLLVVGSAALVRVLRPS